LEKAAREGWARRGVAVAETARDNSITCFCKAAVTTHHNSQTSGTSSAQNLQQGDLYLCLLCCPMGDLIHLAHHWFL
jgi:hypothetical protein